MSPRNATDDKSMSVQVKAWRRQAAHYYLNYLIDRGSPVKRHDVMELQVLWRDVASPAAS